MEYDWTTLETLAAVMGLDFDRLKDDIRRQEELSRLAWVRRHDPRWDTTKAHYRYEEVGAHRGRQVFFNDWFGLYLVRGLEEGQVETHDPVKAMILLYGGGGA